jgi:hypothetical protein
VYVEVKHGSHLVGREKFQCYVREYIFFPRRGGNMQINAQDLEKGVERKKGSRKGRGKGGEGSYCSCFPFIHLKVKYCEIGTDFESL